VIPRDGTRALGRVRTGRVLAVLLICAGFAANAADETPAAGIGRSTFVVNEVDGQAGATPPQHIAVNDDILFNEDITTGAAAKTIIEFRDGSTFEIGPDAVVRIDSFVFNPAESTSQKSLQVARGVFRYVSGYVAGDQETKIATPSGALAIRGSVASGIVDPELPNFIYVGEGNATFTNPAGNSPLQPGDAIAIDTASTAPMPAADMPAPVAAQALGVIEQYLPPRQAWNSRPPESDDWLQRQGTADLVPVPQQRELQAASAGRPMPGLPPGTSLVAALGLLVEGGRLGLFRANPGPRTPEQTAFLTRAARENPNARLALRRYAGEARALHNQNRTAGTQFVIRGVGHSGASPEMLRRFNESTIRANPAAAAHIRRENTRPINRAEPARTRPARPQQAKPALQNRKPPPQNRQPPPQNRSERKPPPKKNEKDKKDQR